MRRWIGAGSRCTATGVVGAGLLLVACGAPGAAPPRSAAREQIDALGAVVRAFDARTAVLFVPVRQIHALATLPLVAAVEPPSRAYGE